MSDQDKIAKNLKRFRDSINEHNRWNIDHSPAYGIAVSKFDLDRLGFDEGETLWSGVTIHSDDKCSGNFRILCDGQHTNDGEISAEENVTHAVGSYA
jgi:hypothetical protein